MSTNVEQCRSCKKLFPFLARGVCADWLKKTEDEFERVRVYLREYDGAAIARVAEETGVSERRIVGWMNEGRLERHGTSRLSDEEAAEQQEARKRLLEGMAESVDQAAATAEEEYTRRVGMRSRRDQ